MPVLGEISTAMRWHRLEISTTQWCKTGNHRLQLLAGWSLEQTGDITRQINAITGNAFGYLGQPRMQGGCWFGIFCEMMKLALADAKAKRIDLKIDTRKLLVRLEAEKYCFWDVQIPRLVHWDLWEGNLFVEHGKIVGIIDFERALWGDPLMEVGFRSYSWQEAFLRGYGKIHLGTYERRRIFWYDIYLFLLVALEYEYREYESDESYRWATDMLARYVAAEQIGDDI